MHKTGSVCARAQVPALALQTVECASLSSVSSKLDLIPSSLHKTLHTSNPATAKLGSNIHPQVFGLVSALCQHCKSLQHRRRQLNIARISDHQSDTPFAGEPHFTVGVSTHASQLPHASSALTQSASGCQSKPHNF